MTTETDEASGVAMKMKFIHLCLRITNRRPGQLNMIASTYIRPCTCCRLMKESAAATFNIADSCICLFCRSNLNPQILMDMMDIESAFFMTANFLVQHDNDEFKLYFFRKQFFLLQMDIGSRCKKHIVTIRKPRTRKCSTTNVNGHGESWQQGGYNVLIKYEKGLPWAEVGISLKKIVLVPNQPYHTVKIPVMP